MSGSSPSPSCAKYRNALPCIASAGTSLPYASYAERSAQGSAAFGFRLAWQKRGLSVIAMVSDGKHQRCYRRKVFNIFLTFQNSSCWRNDHDESKEPLYHIPKSLLYLFFSFDTLISSARFRILFLLPQVYFAQLYFNTRFFVLVTGSLIHFTTNGFQTFY